MTAIEVETARPVSVGAVGSAVAAVLAAVAAVILFDPVVMDWNNPALGQLVPYFAVVDETLAAAVAAAALCGLVLAITGRTSWFASWAFALLILAPLVIGGVLSVHDDLQAVGCGDRACLSLVGPRIAGWAAYYPLLAFAGLMAAASTIATRWHRAHEDAR